MNFKCYFNVKICRIFELEFNNLNLEILIWCLELF